MRPPGRSGYRPTLEIHPSHVWNMFDFTIWTWVTSPSYCHQIAERMTFSLHFHVHNSKFFDFHSSVTWDKMTWFLVAHHRMLEFEQRLWESPPYLSQPVPTQPEHSQEKETAFADGRRPFGGQRRPDPCCLWAGWIGMWLINWGV